MELAPRLRKNETLRETLLHQDPLRVNYRWEQKEGKERAYSEVLVESDTIRLKYQKVVKEAEAARGLLVEQVKELVGELRKYSSTYHPQCEAYYCQGERATPYTPGEIYLGQLLI